MSESQSRTATGLLMVSTFPYPAFFIDFTLFSSYPCYTGTAMPSTKERRKLCPIS
nr:MAG TPA: hypothetical protein [Caudoviricetes sp.]